MATGWGNRLAFIGAGVGLGLAAREFMKRRNALDLQGQVVLITGGSRGLGVAMAREFARNPEPLEIARQQLAEMGAEVLAIPCDVSDREQVQRMIGQASAHFGRIDVLVNNAGVISVGPMEAMTLRDYEEAMNIMFWGMVYPIMAVLPQMRERKSGRIVNITSIGGKVSVPHLLPYSSAKFAAVGFSEGLHADVERAGIKVTTVVPGLMRTGSHVNAFTKGNHAQEYTWFGLAATQPLSSINADRAAQQIVEATRRGETEVILTIQAQILGRVHGLFPGLTVDVLTLVDRVLPRVGRADTVRLSGRESRTPIGSALTSGGEPAAHRYN